MNERTESSRVNWSTVTPVVVTVVLALTGYLYTYYKDLNNAQRAARLERVNAQLGDLYGPLYAFSRVTRITFDEFKKRNDSVVERGEDDASASSTPQFRNYMIYTVRPYFERVETALLEHADLLDEEELPQPLLGLAAHIAAYKPVFEAWQAGEYSRRAGVAFPPGFDEYAVAKYTELKARQARYLQLE